MQITTRSYAQQLSLSHPIPKPVLKSVDTATPRFGNDFPGMAWGLGMGFLLLGPGTFFLSILLPYYRDKKADKLKAEGKTVDVGHHAPPKA